MKISVIRTVYVAVVLCGVCVAFGVLRGENGIPGLMARQHQVHDYEQTNLRLLREIEQKKNRIKRLEENPTEQDQVIREQLKLARPGEKIFILDGDKH